MDGGDEGARSFGVKARFRLTRRRTRYSCAPDKSHCADLKALCFEERSDSEQDNEGASLANAQFCVFEMTENRF
jgi:hypothetical protein